MSFKFGDAIENTLASMSNPLRRSYFVALGYERGRMNPGKYILATDGKGKTWRMSPGEHIQKVSDSTVKPIPTPNIVTPEE